MRKNSSRIFLEIWGPVGITVDKYTKERWAKVDAESIREAFNTIQGDVPPPKFPPTIGGKDKKPPTSDFCAT